VFLHLEQLLASDFHAASRLGKAFVGCFSLEAFAVFFIVLNTSSWVWLSYGRLQQVFEESTFGLLLDIL